MSTLSIMDGNGEDFYDRLVFTKEKKSTVFLIDSKTINTMCFWFKKLSVETWMLKVLCEIGALFEKFLLNSVFDCFLNNVF